MPKDSPKIKPLGYRDVPYGHGLLPDEYEVMKPREMLKNLGDLARDRHLPVGVKIHQTPLSMLKDFGSRIGEFTQEHPDVADLWINSIPKDHPDRLMRAYAQGYRSMGSRGMHRAELENVEDYDSLRNRDRLKSRLGMHIDLTDRLIGPAAGYFGSQFGDRTPVPLATRLDPRTLLVATDSEVNDPDNLAGKLASNDIISSRDLEHVENASAADEATLMRKILRDNGYQSLVYPNTVEGSSLVGSPQEIANTRFAGQAEYALNRLPFEERAEHLRDLPNPAGVILDPSDVRHLLQAEFDPAHVRKLGYKLAAPVAGGLAAYKALMGGNAEAAEPQPEPLAGAYKPTAPITKPAAYKEEYRPVRSGSAGVGELMRGTPTIKGNKVPDQPYLGGTSMGPIEGSDYYSPLTDRADRALVKSFPKLDGLNKKLNSWVPGMGISDVTPFLGEALWAGEILQRPVARAREALVSESFDPIKKLKDEIPNDVMVVEAAFKAPAYALNAAKAGVKKAAPKLKQGYEAVKSKAKRLGRILEGEPEILEVAP